MLCISPLNAAPPAVNPSFTNPSPEKQGVELAGLPLIAYNSDDGFGYGLRAIASNYQPGFAPYKWHIWGQYYKTTKKRENHEVKADLLRAFGTPLRMTFHTGFVRYQSAHYYGIGNDQDIKRNRRIEKGEEAVNENVPQTPDLLQMTLPDAGMPGREDYTWNTAGELNPGRRILRERQDRYFRYDRVEPFAMVTAENWFRATRFKWWVGFKGIRYRIDSYYLDHEDGEAEPNSRTKLDVDQPTGYDAMQERRYVNLLRAALVYDSRPKMREKNPNGGIFADLHYAAAGKATGSHYAFQKLTLTYRQYIELFANALRPAHELVFAFRLQGQETFGDAPFFELGRIYTKEEDAEGLGGLYGLRGYPSNQFVDRIMMLSNAELRFTALKTPWLGGMHWILLGYYDVGRAAARIRELDRRGWHRARGGGLRLVWKSNIVINLSTGRSRYETFSAFSFNHMF